MLAADTGGLHDIHGALVLMLIMKQVETLSTSSTKQEDNSTQAPNYSRLQMNSSSWFALKHVFQMKCMCHITKNVNEEINGRRAQRGILQYESPFGSVPTDPLPAWEKVGIFYSCYQEVFFLSCFAPAFGFSNGWTGWGFEKKHSNSNILIWLFWGGLPLFYRCVCMRQRGVCSAIFKKEPLIFLTLSVSLIPAFIFIFYLFLTFFPAACRSLTFGIGFLQSFQNNYTTWSPSLHFLSFHLLCLSQWGWILL